MIEKEEGKKKSKVESGKKGRDGGREEEREGGREGGKEGGREGIHMLSVANLLSYQSTTGHIIDPQLKLSGLFPSCSHRILPTAE